MPIGNLGHNPNVNNSIPPAPPLPSQTDGAGGRGQLINSTGPLGSRALFTPVRNSMADSGDNRASDVPGLPVNPMRLAASEITLNDGFEVLHDHGPLDTLNRQIGSSVFRVETQEDGKHIAVGQRNGVETSVVLSDQEYARLQSIDPEGKDKFVFTGGRGGAGHAMVTVASDITEARQRILELLEPKGTGESKGAGESKGVGELRESNSGAENTTETQTSTSTSSLRSDPKLWLALGTVATGLIGLAATGIVQALALTPEPDSPTTTDPDAAASATETATRDQLTKEAFQNPDNQKVNIDELGNAIPSGVLKDDVVANIEEQAKAAGEEAKQQAIENNAQAQKKYDEQQAKRQEELKVSSGAGYGLSGALILGGGIGVAVTAALHRKNQPVEQTTTTTTTTTTTSARTVENKPANNTPAQGNVDTPGSEDTMESRRSSMASTSSTFFDTSSIGTVQNPYADVKTSLHDSQVPTSNSNTSVQNMGNTDSVVYSTIQHPPRDTTDNGARLLGNPSAGIQSTYARLALSGGLRHDMGGLTGGSNSAVNTSDNPPAPGSHRFV
ncbi:TPA: type III secretion system LEE translocated intimin receptor Tir [Escherichia coli]|nr:type III secretion system LEE translocated intimin receptor Tir [Escherichia coli]